MHKDNFYVLTGAMGAGKSTVLAELAQQGYLTVAEPARQILQEQRLIGGDGVPEKNPQLFVDLLLSRTLQLYQQYQNETQPVIFDRGILDNAAYYRWFGLSEQTTLNATAHFTYNQNVFYLPPWEAIYHTDDERKMTFQQASRFGEDVLALYLQSGLNIVEIAKVPLAERVSTISNSIENLS